MEIVFEKKYAKRCRESVRSAKRLQESVESVVPDTQEDIAKIVAVQSGVLLRSKDLSGRGVIVTGEARAAVLCITEGREGLAVLRAAKPFSVEFELPELTGEEQIQAALGVTASDARLVNPRKLAVSFELAAELSCFAADSVPTETRVPEESRRGLHTLGVKEELLLPEAVCEKSFAVNEQFPFPAESETPEELLFEQAEIQIDDTQLLGSKAVVKGRTEVQAVYRGQERDDPIRISFSAPFSQIVDVGADSMELCVVTPQLTGAYFDLVDSISGEKLLDVEVHVLLQLVSRNRVSLLTVADAYSNLCPLQAQTQTLRFDSAKERRSVRVDAGESFALAEDCTQTLCVFPSLSRCTLEEETLRAAVHFDLLCRTDDGAYTALRRTVMVEQPCPGPDARLLSVRLCEAELRPGGKGLEARVSLEAQLLDELRREIVCIDAVTLDEEQAFDRSRFPTLTLVRTQGESLWELAKRCHSSVEAIESCLSETPDGGMLLVPKSI